MRLGFAAQTLAPGGSEGIGARHSGLPRRRPLPAIGEGHRIARAPVATRDTPVAPADNEPGLASSTGLSLAVHLRSCVWQHAASNEMSGAGE